jgi:hypothetical protein
VLLEPNNPLSGLIQGNKAHLPTGPGPADPGWGQTQHWGLAGATRSVSNYDFDYDGSQPGNLDMNIHRQIGSGFLTRKDRLPLSAPTMTRDGRIAAQINTLPGAAFFQSYTGSGTGHNWSASATAFTDHALIQNANPNMAGAAELHPATTYDPFPSPSTLYPKVV